MSGFKQCPVYVNEMHDKTLLDEYHNYWASDSNNSQQNW